MQLHGSITALVTPFETSGALDMASWQALISSQLAAGTQGLVVAGSTGEAAMLTTAEFVQLIRSAVDIIAGRVPVLVGAGQSGTQKTIEQCLIAQDAGADALLVVTPPYVRPTQEGLRQHFEAVANAVDIPVVLYNVPSRTGVDMQPETVAQLVSHPRIIAIKEAFTGNSRMEKLLALRSEQFSVLSGDDETACQAQLLGADGVISVVSNLVPATFRALCELSRKGNKVEALALDGELHPLYDIAGCEPNPIPAKAVLAAMSVCKETLRSPLTPLSSTHRPACQAAAELAQLLEKRFLSA